MVHFSGIIALIILFTALLWFAIGWWVSSIERAKQISRRETDWNHQFNTLRRDRDAFRDQVEVAHGKIRVLENRRADGNSPPVHEESEASSRARVTRLQTQLDQARVQISRLSRRVDDMSDKSVEREDMLEKLQKRLTETSRTLHDREQKLVALRSSAPATTPEASANGERVADYEQALQKLRVDAKNQAEAAALDRQQLEQSIDEHRETISALKLENQSRQDTIEQLSQGSKVVEHQRSRLNELQSEVEQQKEHIARLERTATTNEARSDVVQGLNKSLEEQELANRKLTQSHAALEEQLDQTKAELSSMRQALESQQETVSTDEHQALQELLAQHEQAIAQFEHEAHEQRAAHKIEVEQMREAMRAQEQIVSSLRDVLARPATPATASSGATRINPAPAPESGDLFAALETTVPPAKPDIHLYDAPPDRRDNLKRINGIGPAFERALNRLGVYRFEQIAQLGDNDIEWVAHELRSFPDRILNGQWIEQARRLSDSA